ncbi:MAG: hypothetical protein IRZ08_06735 [Frankia sp.]|nr:hypothetical protein [Frankia sp.]
MEKYCDTFWSQVESFQSQMEGAQDADALTQVAAVVAAPQELATMFGRLAKVAPEEIEPDVAVIRDAFQEQADNMGDTFSDPFGTLLSGLLSSAQIEGSWQRVDDFTIENCGTNPPA